MFKNVSPCCPYIQLDQKVDQQKMTQSALEEKRTEMLKTETQLREVEDKYYSSTANMQDQLVQDLRVNINFCPTPSFVLPLVLRRVI